MREILSKSLTVRGFLNYEFAEQVNGLEKAPEASSACWKDATSAS